MHLQGFFCHFSIGSLSLSTRYVLAQGYIGVTVFFVLSGLLIAYRYESVSWNGVLYRDYWHDNDADRSEA